MQIVISKKIKIFIAVFAALVFVSILLLVVIPRAKTEKDVMEPVAISSEITVIKQNNDQVSNISEVKDFLFEKSMLLIISILRSEMDHVSDPIFQNLKDGIINNIKNDISLVGTDVKIKVPRIIVNSDAFSGVVYMDIEGSNQEKNIFTLTYSKDSKGIWKLVNYVKIRPITSLLEE